MASHLNGIEKVAACTLPLRFDRRPRRSRTRFGQRARDDALRDTSRQVAPTTSIELAEKQAILKPAS